MSDDLEQVSPELVLVCPELRGLGSYGPVYAAPARRSLGGMGHANRPPVPLSPFGSVEVSLKVPVLALVAAGAIWDIVARGVLVAGAIVVAIIAVMLLTQ